MVFPSAVAFVLAVVLLLPVVALVSVAVIIVVSEVIVIVQVKVTLSALVILSIIHIAPAVVATTTFVTGYAPIRIILVVDAAVIKSALLNVLDNIIVISDFTRPRSKILQWF